ncbi:MAG: SurA N-terminal domain-containing protein [Treponema sp.]|nr:SurA N-terminal domain-containing protein [Treponema sp.]
MKKLAYIGSVIVLLLLAFIMFFSFNGASELFRKDDELEFGKYDGKPIRLVPGTEFANAVNNYTQYYQQNGANLDDSTYFYIYNYAFNSAVQSMAFKDEVTRTGYVPSEKAVSRIMLQQFTDADGKYNAKLYNQYPDAYKKTLRDEIKRSLLLNRFSEDMFGTSFELGGKKLFGLKTSDKETEFLVSMGETKKSFALVSFSKSNYPEEETKKFVNENKDLFAKIPLSVITVNEEKTAKTLLRQLKSSEISFENAVSEFSEKYYSDNDGVISANFKYQIKNTLENEADLEKLTALANDSYSEIISTKDGYSIFKKTGDIVQADSENASIVSAAKSYITSYEAGKIEDYFKSEADKFITNAKSKGFDEAAQEKGLTVHDIPAFALNYGDTSMMAKIPYDAATELSGAGSNENFWEKIFKLKANEISEPLVLGNNIIVMQMTAEEKTEKTDNLLETIRTESMSYDQSSASSAILSGKKVENNVMTTYFNNFVKKDKK